MTGWSNSRGQGANLVLCFSPHQVQLIGDAIFPAVSSRGSGPSGQICHDPRERCDRMTAAV